MKAVSHIETDHEQVISDESIYSIIRELLSGGEEVDLFESRGVSKGIYRSAK